MEPKSSPTHARGSTGRFVRGSIAIAERFWAKVDRSGACWTWTANRTPLGYGRFSFHGKPTKAHRVSWILVNGAITSDASVLHRCDNPPCVNPDHLFLGSIADNCHDMMSKGRMKEPPLGTINRSKTHCIRGHEFTTENTYLKPRRDGGKGRICITCRNAVRRNGRGKNWRKGA